MKIAFQPVFEKKYFYFWNLTLYSHKNRINLKKIHVNLLLNYHNIYAHIMRQYQCEALFTIAFINFYFYMYIWIVNFFFVSFVSNTILMCKWVAVHDGNEFLTKFKIRKSPLICQINFINIFVWEKWHCWINNLEWSVTGAFYWRCLTYFIRI